MWHQAILINRQTRTIENFSISYFRLENRDCPQPTHYLINLFGYELYNYLQYLTQIDVYFCELDIAKKQGIMNLQSPNKLKDYQSVNILNYLKNVLTKKAMAHPKTQIVFSQLFSP
jgi:hypothetical protein